MRMRLLLCGLLCAAPVAAFAQAGSAQLTGVVHRSDGAGIAGVSVAVTAGGTATTRTVLTGDDGTYVVPQLAPGTYRVSATKTGYAPAAHEDVSVHTAESVRLDIELRPGDVLASVTVVNVPQTALRSESGSLMQSVGERAISSLPLNGRTFVALATLTPGVALPPGQFLPRINGGRPRTNEYLFDGISVLQPEPGQVAYFPIIDAIQDFSIQSNSPAAEFGRFNGGVVNLTTKSGTNTVSGDAFAFVRDQALAARNYFARSNPVKPNYERGQFGGILGGPIKENRTFFFVDYQGQRQDIGRTVTSNVPTLLQRQGIFTEAIGGKVPTIFDPATTVNGVRTPFKDNAIPMDRFDPVAKALLDRYPLPTSAGTANNYTRVGNEIDNQDQFDVRIDHRFGGGGDSAFGRLTTFSDRFVPVTPLPDGSGVTTGTLGPQQTRSWAFASNHLHVFSSRVINEVRVGYTRRDVDRQATSLPGSVEDTIGLPGIPGNAQFPMTLPTFTITGYAQLGSPGNTATNFATDVTEVADTLSWLKGRHMWKMGMDFRWERLNVIQPPQPTGLFNFTNLFTDQPGVSGTGAPFASFLLGQVQNSSIDLQQNQIQNRAHIQEYFIQDEWKVTRRITLAYGTRYTLNFPSTEASNQVAVFNLDTQKLDFLGQDGLPNAARQLQKHDFGPRVGIADRLTDRMVLRAGYGLVWIEQAGITTPFTTPSFPFLQTVTQRTLDNITPAFVLANGPTVVPAPIGPDAGLGQGVFAVNAPLGSGYVQQWNAAVQHEIRRGLSVEVAYVGSQITNVGLPDANINQLTVDQLALKTFLTEKVPNPYFGIIPRSSSLGDPTITRAQLLKPFPTYTAVALYRNNIGTTNYQGATIKVEQRLTHGLSYLVSYTRSHLVDDASSVFDASILTGPQLNAAVADAFNRKLDRDVSTGDIPNVFVASAVWDLPFGPGRTFHPEGVIGAIARDWTVTTVVTLQSGLPFPVTQGTNNNAFAGFTTQRPNLVGNPNLPADQRTIDRWFDTTAFSVAPIFTLGTSTRNPVRGPDYRNVDLAFIRHVPLDRSAGLEFRVEIFNLLNTTQLNAPNAVVGTAGFGSINSALDPRVVQLAVKILF
jgi:hypothetical protein